MSVSNTLSIIAPLVALSGALVALGANTWDHNRRPTLGFLRLTGWGWAALSIAMLGCVLAVISILLSIDQEETRLERQARLTYAAATQIYEPLLSLMARTMPFQIQLTEKGAQPVGIDVDSLGIEFEYETFNENFSATAGFPYRISLMESFLRVPGVSTVIIDGWIDESNSSNIYLSHRVEDWRISYRRFLDQFNSAVSIYGPHVSPEFLDVIGKLQRHPIVFYAEKILSERYIASLPTPIPLVAAIDHMQERLEKSPIEIGSEECSQPGYLVFCSRRAYPTVPYVDADETLKIIFSDLPVFAMNERLLRYHMEHCRQRSLSYLSGSCAVPRGRDFAHIRFRYGPELPALTSDNEMR